MAKLPAFQFYPGDWLKDPAVSLCQPSTRGIWWDAICAMHESNRSGTLVGTPDQLVRVLRCSRSELHTAIADLKATGTADVTERSGKITIINRRMHREWLSRLKNRDKQEKWRRNHNVTSSSSSSTSNPPNPLGGDEGDENGIQPPGGPVAEMAAREAQARSFAQAWIQSHYPRYNRLHHQFARLILARGKDAAVAAVEQVIANGKTSNPFGYVEVSWTDEDAKASIALAGANAKPVADWKEGVLPDGRKQKLTPPPDRAAVG